MSAENAPTAHVTPSQDLQAAALALWTFVHTKLPRFSTEVALDIVTRLTPAPGDDPKEFAKRLRVALREAGISVKHTAALEAASRVLGRTAWHDFRRDVPKPSQLNLLIRADTPEELFDDWGKLAPRLCDWVVAFQKHHQVKVIQVHFGTDYVYIAFPLPKEGTQHGETEMQPIASINATVPSPHWLEEAPMAFEMLRRRLEEPGLAIVDGVEVLHLCGRNEDGFFVRSNDSEPVTAADAYDSELVLFRGDSVDGFEIARGDEMTCWSQLDLSLEGKPQELTFVDGVWRIGNGDYNWRMTTLRGSRLAVQPIHVALSAQQSARLLHRYRLAKKILAGKITHHQVSKQLNFLSAPGDTYKANLVQIFRELAAIGMDWPSFCAEQGLELLATNELPLGIFMALAERLKLKDPDRLFAQPARAELALAVDDDLLRSLRARVDHVRYRIPKDLPQETREQVKDAIEDFSVSLRLQKLQAAGQFTDPSNPLPHLVFAGDGEELRLRMQGLGLDVYIGVVPHLMSTEGIAEKLPNMWTYAFGHSLYLDLACREGSL